MKMGTRYKIYSVIFYAYVYVVNFSYGCSIDGVDGDLVVLEINDHFRGVIFENTTTNIQSIVSIFPDPHNRGPYVDVSLENSTLIIQTNDNYEHYEEYETLQNIFVNVQFPCNSQQLTVTFLVLVNDTNNHNPRFMPDDEYEFVVIPPLPPNYEITKDIRVRDIDLTTQRIDFEVVDSPNFEINYDASSNTPKEFGSVLRTTTFIRNIPEPYVLKIKATDVDLTGDPRRSTIATVRIVSSGEFEIPDELAFTQTFYIANYTESDQIVLQEPISLQQGYHEDVEFSLDTTDQYREYFRITSNSNNVVLEVLKPIPEEFLVQRKLFLAVRADREFTIGTSATVIIQLPEVVNLQFEKSIYEGAIIDNTLDLHDLLLSHSYENQPFAIEIISDYRTFFTPVVQGNTITLSMSSLPSTTIEENNVINLQVIASTTLTSAATVVTLEIVKDDTITPVFDRSVYTGSYDPENNLKIQEILIVQGYSDVTLHLEGDHANLFNVSQNEEKIELTASTIPVNLFSEGHIILTVIATKPRTVGANAVISISLPSARNLDFSKDAFKGTIQNGELLLDPIILSTGYADDVAFNIVGDYSTYFKVTNNDNEINIALPEGLPENVTSENNFLLMTLIASAEYAISASANILLEIIQEDVPIPRFSQHIYTGVYSDSNLDIGDIILSEGYDDTVTFHLEGDYLQFFAIYNNSDSVSIIIQSTIPEELIFNEKMLLLNIVATKPLAVEARAVISIKFPPELTEPAILSFAKNVYNGILIQNSLELESIVLDTGFNADTEFKITGQYIEYFTVRNESNVINISPPETSLPSNIQEDKYIVFEVEATRVRAISAYTTVIIEIRQPEIVPLIFTDFFYKGAYTEANGIHFEKDIYLPQGFDDTVFFELDGESTQWITVTQNTNPAIITITELPEDELGENDQLIFTLVAQKPESIAHATIIVDLPKNIAADPKLGFEQISYVGSIQGSHINLPLIVLREGYTSNVTFFLHGDLKTYFSINDNQDATVTVTLAGAIPEELIPSSGFIVLDIEASAAQTMSAFATVVLEVASEDGTPPLSQLTFTETYYIGAYTSPSALTFDTPIMLGQGQMAADVEFALEGDNIQWFGVVPGNDEVTLAVTSAIPPAVLSNNQQLVFAIIASRPGSAAARSTIVVILPNDIAADPKLGFEQISYVGSIQGSHINLPLIVLREGYTSNVTFSLHGDLKTYFSINDNQDATVTVTLAGAIPEELIPSSGIIVLDIEASAAQTMSAFATVVLEVASEDGTPPLSQLTFTETYYIGAYTSPSALTFDTPIMLGQGQMAADVEFALEGDNIQWFGVVPGNDEVTLAVTSAIPPAVLSNNQQLVFAITASRPGSAAARSTIVVILPNDIAADPKLGFEQISYVGSIQGSHINLPLIVLREGYTSNVTFSLHGDLKTYFSINDNQDATVTVTLASAIPEELIPTSGIIVLDIEASAAQTMSAFATVVLEVASEDGTPPLSQLAFTETYYIGAYTSPSALTFDTPIMLGQGQMAADVEFALEGDNIQWFGVVPGNDEVTLAVTSAIPPAVLSNNQQLVFAITASRPGSAAARSTIVVILPNDIAADPKLGFEQISYVGSIQGSHINLPLIVLREGYTSNVTFSLHGDLKTYFSINDNQDATVTVTLAGAIPEELIPSSGIIVLDIEASAAQTMSAFATVVLEVASEDGTPPLSQLTFTETYYIGAYTSPSALTFDTPIMLGQGQMAADVEFALEGDNIQWFGVVPGNDEVTLAVTSAIPPAVLSNNQQLVFAITASRPGSAAARSTIVVILPNDIAADPKLGFEQISYVGSIQGSHINLPLIVLREGYTSNVTFSLHGDLKTYFSINDNQDATVTVTLAGAIPEELIPSSGIIVLDIEASAAQTMSAFATVVLEVASEDGTPPLSQLTFTETYYIGAYTSPSALTFDTPIMLGQGQMAADVEFALEGDNIQWFGVVPGNDEVTLAVTSAIPPAVLSNNQQLVFAITASRPGSAAARSTIVVILPNDIAADPKLGFEQISYVGSIQGSHINLPLIVLREGYTSNVTFSLHGDLKTYFSINDNQDATVTVTLASAIPEELIPTSGIIVLDIEASAAQTMSAFATVVLEVASEDGTPPLSQLAFTETYYIGAYTSPSALTFDTPIMLGQGQMAADVEFALEGDNIQWFGVVPGDDEVTLAVTSAIPPAVLSNNHQLVFAITASRPGSAAARSTIVVILPNDIAADPKLGFEQISYVGSIQGSHINLPLIVLREGYTSNVTFSLHGDLKTYFSINDNQDATVTVTLAGAIPEELIPSSGIIVLDIEASAAQTMSAFATVVLEVASEDGTPPLSQLTFTETYYIGAYTSPSALTFDTPIMLGQGQMAADVEFALEGDNIQWFGVVPGNDEVTLAVTSAIPPAVLSNNQQLVFAITASRPGSAAARSTIVVILPNDIAADPKLGFEQISYVGSIQGSHINLPLIVLREGYTSNVTFSLHGDLKTYFSINDNQDATVTVTLASAIPEELIPTSGIIVLDIEASAAQTMSAFATVVLEVASEDGTPPLSQLAFTETYYIGAYTSPSALTFDTPIMLGQGQMAADVEFALEGDNIQWFGVVPGDDEVTLAVTSAIPPAVLSNNHQLVFAITASRPGSAAARSTIVVILPNDIAADPKLGFEQISYVGSIQGSHINLPLIVLREGYTSNVTFSLHGDLKTYFSINDNQDATVTVTLASAIPEELIPSSGIIVLDIEASAAQTMSAFATVVLEVASEDGTPSLSQLAFTETYYIGAYTSPSALTFDTPIMLGQGQMAADVEFALEGDNIQWFGVVPGNDEVTLVVTSAIPPAVLSNNQQLVFAITASRPGSAAARSTIVVILPNDTDSSSAVVFNKVLYKGRIHGGYMQHETIILNGYDGSDVEIIGVYSAAFRATHTDGVVIVESVGTLSLPPNIQYIILELRADKAGAVLLLEYTDTDIPVTPTVTFGTPSYVIRIGINHFGPVSRVEATADNGESVTYSLSVDNQQLQARLSITNDGEILVSAPVNSGVYDFQVIATTIFTQARGTAMVYLTVEAITTCGDNDIVSTPMIVIDRDEEQPNRNLVVLDPTQHAGCKYIISNSWPADQEWFYVDETGLHSYSIEREHPSIAFMALSQIQAELTLQCDSETKRRKRFVEPRLNSLGPYDYGDNSWIIGKTIEYDPRKTIVNLIVNDINDNPPIFVGKENEPIVVGYPVANIQSTILPRSLVELQATDADVGINAAIVYSSTEPQLAVSSTTGFVHVKNEANLVDNMQLTVRATDLNGQGLTGTISILVKMLEPTNIVVLTVRNSFLEDENSILNNISYEVGYEVKALRSAVILNADSGIQATRTSRNVPGASLEIYIYGLIDREPVSVEKLVSDLTESASTLPVVIASIYSLEKHLEAQQSCSLPSSNTGLLAATIVLSVLLFSVIVAAIVWFLLRWKRKQNYRRFTNSSDLNSQSDAGSEIKAEVPPRPRINVEELKRSEKRLQEMLKAPVEDVTVEPSTAAINPDTVISLPDTILAPIVIQDKLKDADESDEDEFGERKKARRKSVVTFNENVEKIITIDNTLDDENDENDENENDVYRL